MQSETAPVHPTKRPAESSSGPHRRVLTLSFLALLAGVGVAVFAERARYEKYAGFLHARTRQIAAGRDASISRIFAEQGTVVAAGTPLLTLRDDALEERLEEKRRDVTALEAEFAQTEAKLVIELAWRQKEVRTEVFETRLKSAHYLKLQFSNQVENLVTREALRETGVKGATADTSDAWIQSLLDENRTTDEERKQALLRHQAAINALEVSTVQVELCEERLTELEQLGRELPDKIRQSMGLNLVQARLDRNRAELAALEQQKEGLTLVAEAPGLVGVFRKGAGDHVAAHDLIVQLIDEDQPYLVVQIPSPRIGDFTKGTVVDLWFPGGKKGKGRVTEIPPQTSLLSENRESGDTSLVSAHIEPAGVAWPALPFGASVEVRRKK